MIKRPMMICNRYVLKVVVSLGNDGGAYDELAHFGLVNCVHNDVAEVVELLEILSSLNSNALVPELQRLLYYSDDDDAFVVASFVDDDGEHLMQFCLNVFSPAMQMGVQQQLQRGDAVIFDALDPHLMPKLLYSLVDLRN